MPRFPLVPLRHRTRLPVAAMATSALVSLAAVASSANAEPSQCPTGLRDPIAMLPDGTAAAIDVPLDARFVVFRSSETCDHGQTVTLTRNGTSVPLALQQRPLGRGRTPHLVAKPRAPLEPGVEYELTVSPPPGVSFGPQASTKLTTGTARAVPLAGGPTLTLSDVLYAEPPVAEGTRHRTYKAVVDVSIPAGDPGKLAVVHLLAADVLGRSLRLHDEEPVTFESDLAASYPMGGDAAARVTPTFTWFGRAPLCLVAVIEDSAGRMSPPSALVCEGGKAGDVKIPADAPRDPAEAPGSLATGCAAAGASVATGAPSRIALALAVGISLSLAARRRRATARRAPGG